MLSGLVTLELEDETNNANLYNHTAKLIGKRIQTFRANMTII